MEKPLVSVLLTSYNYGEYIGKAIESALNQTYADIEVLISDNGSLDGSREIIESFKDKRIKTNFFEVNRGPEANLEMVMSMSRGKYYAHLNADDYWEADKIEKQVEFLEKNSDYGAVFSHVLYVDAKGEIYNRNMKYDYDVFTQPNMTRAQYLHEFFFRGNFLCISSALIHKDLFDEVYQESSVLCILGDFYFWTQIVKKTGLHIIQEPLTCYRIHGKNMSMIYQVVNNQTKLKSFYDLANIYEFYFDDIPEDLFIEAFSDRFINPGVSDQHSLMCEKIFLYLRKTGAIYKNIAARKLFALRQNKEFMYVLRNVYKFTKENNLPMALSHITVGTDPAIQLDYKFSRAMERCAGSFCRAAVYAQDVQITGEMLAYMRNNSFAGFTGIICVIANFDGNAVEVPDDTPVVSLKEALIDYNVNTILIAGRSFDQRIYGEAKSISNSSVEIVELCNMYEKLCRY